MADPLKYVNPVQRYRVDAGLSIEQAAEATGLNPRTLTQLERGEAMPKIGTVMKLAGAFGISPSELLNEIRAARAQAAA